MELWDLNLVDPDNRKLVDYQLRKAYLDDIMKRKEKELSSLILKLLADTRNKIILRGKNMAKNSSTEEDRLLVGKIVIWFYVALLLVREER